MHNDEERTPQSSQESGTAPTAASPRHRVISFDVINILACFMVVLIHANTVFYTYSPSLTWLSANAIFAVCMSCVPLFFMLSGATNLGYRGKYTTRQFLTHRFQRTLPPLIIWSAIGYGLDFLLIPYLQTGHVAEHVGLGNFLRLTASHQIVPVYWFFFPLFGFYLAAPLFSRIVQHPSTLTYAVAAWFALQICTPYALLLTNTLDTWNPPLAYALPFEYCGYALLGYWLATTHLAQPWRWGLYVAGIASAIWQMLSTYLNATATGSNTAAASYLTPHIVIMSAAVFVWVQHLNLDALHTAFHGKLAQWIARISACSFGVYLMHYIVFHDALWRLVPSSFTSWAWRTVGAVGVYAGCVAIVFLVKRIPLMRRIFP